MRKGGRGGGRGSGGRGNGDSGAGGWPRRDAHENIYIECWQSGGSFSYSRPSCSQPSFFHHALSTPLSRPSLCSSLLLHPFIPDKRRQPPTDSSANSVSELQDFSCCFPPSTRTSLPSRPCLALHGPRLVSPRLASCQGYRAAESAVVTYPASSPALFPSLSNRRRRRQTKSSDGTNIVADAEANAR